MAKLILEEPIQVSRSDVDKLIDIAKISVHRFLRTFNHLSCEKEDLQQHAFMSLWITLADGPKWIGQLYRRASGALMTLIDRDDRKVTNNWEELPEDYDIPDNWSPEIELQTRQECISRVNRLDWRDKQIIHYLLEEDDTAAAKSITKTHTRLGKWFVNTLDKLLV